MVIFIIFASSLVYSQNRLKEVFGYSVITHFPKGGAGNYIYKKDFSDNDYLVISGSTIENRPIIMELEVKNGLIKLYMHIKNNGNPKTSLSFSKVKFKLDDVEVSYVIKEYEIVNIMSHP